MARDVEFNMTASDKTGPAFDGVARKSEQTQAKIRKDSEKSSDAASSGWVKAFAKAGPKIVGAVGQAASTAAANAGPILGGAAVAAAPIIAGTLSAAIIGGAAIGGVIGGVALVKDDPRVAAAGADLGRNLTSNLKDFARPFIEPVIAGAAKIESRFDEVGGNLRNIFAKSSGYVDPLINGATRFLQGIVRGADALIARAGPVINALDVGLTELGGDVETFLTQISEGSDGAAAAVSQLIDLFGGTLAVLGPLINGINQVSSGLDSLGISPGLLQLIGRLTDAADTTGTFTPRVQGATDAITAQGEAASVASQDLTALEAAIRGNVNAEVQLYGAATNAAAAVADATEKIRENGEGLSLNSERGRENRGVLQNLAGSLNANYDAYVKVHGAGQAADEVLRTNRENFIRVATAASGSAAKARQLANDLLGIPDKRQPKVELLDNASGKINNVINRLAAVRSKTVTLNIAVRQSGDAAALRKQSAPSGLSAASHFAAAGDAGTYRTGGPTPVDVTSSVSVLLDGRPFREYTTQAIESDRRRTQWRNKIGNR